jgi:hypothetical protein
MEVKAHKVQCFTLVSGRLIEVWPQTARLAEAFTTGVCSNYVRLNILESYIFTAKYIIHITGNYLTKCCV